MENCLVTKLKGSVNKDLPKVGCMRVYFHVASNYDPSKRYINVDPFGASIDITIEGGQFVDSTGQPLGVSTLSINAGSNIYVSNDEAIVYIPKYPLAAVIIAGEVAAGSIELDVDDCSYIGTAIPVAGRTCDFAPRRSAKGDIAALKHTTFNTVDLAASAAYGDISNIANSCKRLIVNYTQISGELVISQDSILDTLNISNTNIAFNINQLENHHFNILETRNAVNIYGDVKWLFDDTVTIIDIYNAVKVTGTVESGVERAWGLSRRSGTIQFSTAMTSVTLNGVNMGTYATDFKIVFSANNVQILNYFTEAVLATYDGSTWTYTV